MSLSLCWADFGLSEVVALKRCLWQPLPLIGADSKTQALLARIYSGGAALAPVRLGNEKGCA
jgi:hypothetical protein